MNFLYGGYTGKGGHESKKWRRRGGGVKRGRKNEEQKSLDYRWNPDGSVEICRRYVMEVHDRTIETSSETRKDTWRLEAKYYCAILYKRADTESVGNYRGISLLCIMYKWYAEILRIEEKLKEEIGKKNIISKTQDSEKASRS